MFCCRDAINKSNQIKSNHNLRAMLVEFDYAVRVGGLTAIIRAAMPEKTSQPFVVFNDFAACLTGEEHPAKLRDLWGGAKKKSGATALLTAKLGSLLCAVANLTVCMCFCFHRCDI